MGERLGPYVKPGLSRGILNIESVQTGPTVLVNQDKALLRAILSPDRRIVREKEVKRAERVIWQS